MLDIKDIECPKCHRKGDWKELRNGGIKCKQCLHIMGIDPPKPAPKGPIKFDSVEECPYKRLFENYKKANQYDCFTVNSPICKDCEFWGYRKKVKEENDATVLPL